MRRPPPTKHEIRQDLNHSMDEYLAKGGTVEEIPKGHSGRLDQNGIPAGTNHVFIGPKQGKREYLTDTVAALENRKKQKSPTTKSSHISKAPKKHAIYDDFGEIIRYEWRD